MLKVAGQGLVDRLPPPRLPLSHAVLLPADRTSPRPHDQHTELTEVGAIPGRFLEPHDEEGTGLEKARDDSVTVRDRGV